MPDSLQNITFDPAISGQLDAIEADFKASQSRSEQKEKPSRADLPRRDVRQLIDTLPQLQDAPHHKKVLMLTAHKEPQMPVSTRSTGSPVTSWIIVGLVALFLLVSMRYRTNFSFLRGIASQLLSHRKSKRMFDDTVRETSFLIMLNLLCVVSVGVLLFGAFEIMHPELKMAPRWYAALGVVSATVAVYYIFQWLLYMLIGKVFTDKESADLWLRGFSAGQGILGIVLFPLALVSIFYAKALTGLVVAGGVAYLLARLIFICKGVMIFSKKYTSYMPFFYYLCSAEIAPVVLAYNLAWYFCTLTAF